MGLERFAATQGWAWDRHKLGGKLVLPPAGSETYTILAVQSYWFYCEECGCEEVVSGSQGGPHSLLRTFSWQGGSWEGKCWRYRFEKHGINAWMDINRDGYVADSAGIGFSPW